MTNEKAMRLALDALESVYGRGKKCEAAIKTLRAALVQPEREQQGLTDEEIDKVFLAAEEGYLCLSRAIEAKLKEKNNG